MTTSTFVRDDLVWDPNATPGTATALRGSQCRECGRTEFPRLAECPACGGGIDDVRLGPEATLAGFTEVLHPPPGALVEVPYTIALAAFAQNLTVMGVLDHHMAAVNLAIGTPLEVCVVEYGEGRTYGFRLG